MFDSAEKREEVLSQLKKIRDSGKTNMMDARGVQRIASKEGFHALVLELGGDPFENYGDLLEEFEEYLDELWK